MRGKLIISLDFELHWGVFDVKTVESYKSNLQQVRAVITKMILLADKYNIKLTFSTVGFLFAENKQELISYLPSNKPTYKNPKFSPYPLLDSIGNNEKEDPFHYAKSVIKEIKNNGNHEIGTHTFCHYYCHEAGQNIQQFNDDISSAIRIAKSMDIELKSIVFPRNMIEANKAIDRLYLEVCKKHGINSFRGKEKAYMYNIHTTKFYHSWYIWKLLRILDAYINITGNNTYKIKKDKTEIPLNIPSSRLLRSYSKPLSFIEPLKISRVTRAMKYAAKNNEVFHLWWHPHNFGTHTEKNFKNLESIFKTYVKLEKQYGFKSQTMSELTNDILKQ